MPTNQSGCLSTQPRLPSKPVVAKGVPDAVCHERDLPVIITLNAASAAKELLLCSRASHEGDNPCPIDRLHGPMFVVLLEPVLPNFILVASDGVSGRVIVGHNRRVPTGQSQHPPD